MVGSAIVRRLQHEGCEILTASRAELDLRRQDQVETWMSDRKPDVIFLAAAKVGGIPDYVADGKNGILFAPGDGGAFIKAIREGVNHPLFGKGGVDAETLRTARDYLSPSRMAENFFAAYRVALRR